ELVPALPVDVEKDVATILQRLVDRGAGGPVAVAVDLRPLRELARGDHAVEGRGIDEAVVHPVDLAGARSAGRYRDREHQVRVVVGEPTAKRGLARTGRRRDHDEEPTRHRRAVSYSTFCACSRNFSSSALASTMRRDTSADCDLAPMVFTSRPISCTRKSSLRPTAPGVA